MTEPISKHRLHTSQRITKEWKRSLDWSFISVLILTTMSPRMYDSGCLFHQSLKLYCFHIIWSINVVLSLTSVSDSRTRKKQKLVSSRQLDLLDSSFIEFCSLQSRSVAVPVEELLVLVPLKKVYQFYNIIISSSSQHSNKLVLGIRVELNFTEKAAGAKFFNKRFKSRVEAKASANNITFM